MKSIQTFMLFVGEQAGKAEEAITLYTSLFRNSEITSIVRHEGSEHEKDGTVLTAKFTLNDLEFIAMDSALKHEFTFTPAISLFVDCETDEEIDNAYTALVEDGKELMPMGDYGFSQKFVWLEDRYDVSWQLNLA